jgi:hypothetical protein
MNNEGFLPKLRLPSSWLFYAPPAWPRQVKENARMIIAGSAVNGVLRHEVYKIACAATVTV